nr:unnamed protein product [Callosobruchus chinensis]
MSFEPRNKLVFGSYEYKLERRFHNRLAWSCRNKEKFKCKARCYTYRDSNVIEIRYDVHNHSYNVKADVRQMATKKCTLVQLSVISSEAENTDKGDKQLSQSRGTVNVQVLHN